MSNLRSLLAVALVSAVGLAYEVLLTNLYAVTMQYHYVFLALSAAMFGAGIGALAMQKLRRLREEAPRVLDWGLPAVLAGLLPLLVPTLLWLAEAGWTPLLVLLSALPFVLVGAYLALVLRRLPDRAPQVYGADLLGAALGAALAPVALTALGGPGAGLLLALVAGVAGLLVAPRQVWTWLATAVAAAALLLQATTGWVGAALNMARLQGAPPDKTLVAALQQPGAHIRATRWDAFARVDEVETADPSRRTLFLDGGAGSYMYRWDGHLDSLGTLKQTPEFLPFAVGSAARTLVIGPGGGRDVLLALLAGAQHVDAVEISPGVVQAVRADADYNGHLIDRPGVNWAVADGRNFLRSAIQPYDLIVLDLVYTQVSGARSYALAENYIFTQEAFRDYYQHLAPGGRIAVIAHQALEGSRAVLTGFAAWQQAGGAQPAAVATQGALLMTASNDAQTRTTLAVWQKGSLSTDQLQVMQVAGKALDLSPLFVPGVYEAPFQPLVSGQQNLAAFTAAGDYNLAPTSDNRPFFFNLDWGLPTALREVAGLVLLLALGFGLWAAYPERRPEQRSAQRPAGRTPARGGKASSGTAQRPLPGAVAGWRLYGYTAVVGIAYMLLQLPLIQRWLLVLGSPVLTTSAVLTALLGGAGIASLLAQRWPGLRTHWVCVGVGGLALLYTGLVPLLTPALLALSLGGRLAAVTLLCLPLGFLLGLPFPRALDLGHRQGARLPLLYAVSSVASIVGSVLATVLAIGLGVTAAMLLGAAAYALAAWILPTPPTAAQKERKNAHAEAPGKLAAG